MTATAATFKEARIWASFSGEYLQFLNCVLASYSGFFTEGIYVAVAAITSAAIFDVESKEAKPSNFKFRILVGLNGKDLLIVDSVAMQ